MLNSNIKNFGRISGVNTGYKFYTFKNNRGESITVEISDTKCDPKNVNCLPNSWVRCSYIKKPIYHYLNCRVVVHDKNGVVSRDYNPTTKTGYETSFPNFKWMLPATKSNENKILNEVYRRANRSKPSLKSQIKKASLNEKEIKKQRALKNANEKRSFIDSKIDVAVRTNKFRSR